MSFGQVKRNMDEYSEISVDGRWMDKIRKKVLQNHIYCKVCHYTCVHSYFRT